MLTIQQINDQLESQLNGDKVIAANNHDGTCFHLLIKTINNEYWNSYWVLGQPMGITYKGNSKGKAFKTQPKFNANIY